MTEKASINLTLYDEPPAAAIKRLRAYHKIALAMEADLRKAIGDPFTPKEFTTLLADINKRCDRLDARCTAAGDLSEG